LPKGKMGARWWVLAASSALLITALVAAVVYLITKQPSVVDQVVIVTVPSGAEIKLNAKSYGNSPVKLEQVKVGTYTLTISKEGYETIEDQVNIAETPQLEYTLKHLTPEEAVGRTAEERILMYQEKAATALASNHYVWPKENNAIYWVDLIRELDPANQFAIETRETIRRKLLQSALAAASRGDLGDAKETVNVLLESFPKDGEILAAANKLETQLATRRGEVRDWIHKAEEALRGGNLLDPQRGSALYFVRQALAIESQNPQAIALRGQIKDQILRFADQAQARGDTEGALRQLQQAALVFDDRQIHTRIKEIRDAKAAEIAKALDPDEKRKQGLLKYVRGDYYGAVEDLLFASTNGKGTPDVIFALGHSYFQQSKWDQAATYLRDVPRSVGDQYISSRGLLGEIAFRHGDMNTALDYYKEAHRLGGSNMYLLARLEDLIERIEKRQQEKAAAPTPIAIKVKHDHGALRGSCEGNLSVDGTGVRYDGEHSFAANLVGVTARVEKKALTLGFQGRTMKFEINAAEAERFREALMKYQDAAKK
jgi:hypothetical protein